LHGLVAGFLHGLVTGFAFITVASLADLLVDGFLNRLIARVPSLFQDCVVHQLVAGAALLLTRGEAALGVAAGLRTAGVLGRTTIACDRGMDSPEQADHRSQQRRSQAHPHDLPPLVILDFRFTSFDFQQGGVGAANSALSQVKNLKSSI
jgi:hypothetical protein